jgi:ribonuclease P protein component
VLAAAHRLTDARSFRDVVRDGRRAGSRTLVVHLVGESATPGPRVGLVVAKAVGNSVVRHRVQRQLRHLAREQLHLLPASAALVVRALPAAAGSSSRELGEDLTRCLRRVMT